MSNKELLELAAKAAGYLNWTPSAEGLHIETGSSRGWSGFYWNPLTDDGDALRLAVDLCLNIEYKNDGRVYVWNSGDGNCSYLAIGSSREDRLANTRRAIVEVAALIGKDTEKNND